VQLGTGCREASTARGTTVRRPTPALGFPHTYGMAWNPRRRSLSSFDGQAGPSRPRPRPNIEQADCTLPDRPGGRRRRPPGLTQRHDELVGGGLPRSGLFASLTATTPMPAPATDGDPEQRRQSGPTWSIEAFFSPGHPVRTPLATYTRPAPARPSVGASTQRRTGPRRPIDRQQRGLSRSSTKELGTPSRTRPYGSTGNGRRQPSTTCVRRRGFALGQRRIPGSA